MKTRKLFFILILTVISQQFLLTRCYSQPYFLPLNRDIHNLYERSSAEPNFGLHSSLKPFLLTEIEPFINVDSIKNINKQGSFLGLIRRKKPVTSLEKIRKHADAAILFSIQPGYDLYNSDKVLESSIGASISCYLNEKLSFSASFLSANSGFTGYLDSIIREREVVPGQGYGYKTGLGYAYSIYSGYISYSPSKYFNFQLGNDKNFWGNGYRSLLLSDNSYNYPFLKISSKIWKLKYVNLFTVFRDVSNSAGKRSEFKRKYGSFHFLSWNATKWLNIGLFEAIIWQGEDDSGIRGYDVNYLNPIIFYRPVEYSVGSPDNVLLGFDLKIKLTKRTYLYGQIIMDEFLLKHVREGDGWWGNKQGLQAGIKCFDLLKINNLDLLSEINYVRPYTYSHGNSLQNYSHFNQPLAHPLGANFYESVSLINYRHKSWMFEGKVNYIIYGADTSGSNWGGDIFLDYKTPNQQEFNNETAQGVRTTIVIADIKISYLLFAKTNLRAEVGISNRIQQSEFNTGQTQFIYFGLRTALSNVYHDL